MNTNFEMMVGIWKWRDT